MPVDDGAAEGDLVDRIAIRAKRKMSPSQHPFKVGIPWLSKPRDAVRFQTAVIVFGLMLEPLVTRLGRKVLDDRLDHRFLLGIEEPVTIRVSSHAIGVDLETQGIVPTERDDFLLVFAQILIELANDTFGSRFGTGSAENHRREEAARIPAADKWRGIDGDRRWNRRRKGKGRSMGGMVERT